MAEVASKRAKMTDVAIAERCINTIRTLAADVVQKANSGHPGAPMGCAPMAHLLWSEIMNYDSSDWKWVDRDRFVLSNGHACALQYIMLHLTGYPVSMGDLKAFRQVGSKTPGHPESHLTEGIEVSTGPLGQGISNAVGLAIAEAHLAAKYNRDGFPVIDHYTYVIMGDGCMQEGISSETCSLAGHLGLGKLIVLYDDNLITIDGETHMSFTENVCMRYESYGWHTQVVEDGDSFDASALRAAIEAAKKVTDKPSLIKVRTTIGWGSQKQGTEKVHGSPLGPDDIKQLKQKLGFDPESFFVVPADVAQVYADAKTRAAAKHAAWQEMFQRYQQAYPDLAADLLRCLAGKLPANFAANLPKYSPSDKALATRQSSQQVLAALVDAVPEIIGGSADLTPSTLTKVKGNDLDFQKETPAGRYLRFGVREHGMAAICNGIAAHGGLIPFGSTFLNFTGYAMGAVRLSALSRHHVLYIMTHDSIGLGEDGPTHQPVEMLSALRATPNMLTFRPADGNEVAGSYKVALEHNHNPSVLALSRQGCDHLSGSDSAKVALGGYVLQEAPGGKPQVTVISTGSEVQICVKAAALLAKENIAVRIVSMPCTELFDQQPQDYQASVLIPGVPVLSVEAASILGWEKYSHAHVAMVSFGASGPVAEVYKYFGFTPENIADKARKLVAHYGGNAPSLQRPSF